MLWAMQYQVFRKGSRLWIARRSDGGSERAVRVDDLALDDLFRADDPWMLVEERWAAAGTSTASDIAGIENQPLDAPVESQEVWAAGVTYFRSRTARMEESEASGGDRFYDLVYEAERPELFFKATARRARGHRQPVRIRSDSRWDVPEPELALAIGASGRIFAYCIGNDMSSRDIEGQNPLYLPQAKIYTGSCSLGPCLTLMPEAPGAGCRILMTIRRDDATVFEGETTLGQMKRGLEELAGFLFQENDFPDGAVLMTGTGIVPGDGFTLRRGDEIVIAIDGLGELQNRVA